MTTKLYSGNNKLLMRSGEKLFLDAKTADVNLLVKIDADHFETIPAHKIILSAGSCVFESMFYGPSKVEGDIQIFNSSPDIFKEFLKLFYRSNIILTSESIFAVTDLCKRYEVADGLTFCEIALQKILSTNDMARGYELGLSLELEKVIQFCEQKIKRNPDGILKSTDFLECKRQTLSEILTLVSPKCSATLVVNAGMNWAKNKCKRKNVEATAENLRKELGSSLSQMPFAGLEKEEFLQFIVTYKGLLSETDLEEIILKVKENENEVIIHPVLDSSSDSE